ncbi:MAG: hypothetical protein JWO22_2181 [Frankiales bacterium]|nr:hypothetical protein [Frankiales bacterium]
MRTHPRTSGAAPQLAVLLTGVLAGLLIGSALHWADGRSWGGSHDTTAVVVGLEHDGIHAMAGGRDVVLHLEKVPPAGTEVRVEVRPDGRARPTSYRQTWPGALGRGVALAVGLLVIVQLYRFFVTGRPVERSVPSDA